MIICDWFKLYWYANRPNISYKNAALFHLSNKFLLSGQNSMFILNICFCPYVILAFLGTNPLKFCFAKFAKHSARLGQSSMFILNICFCPHVILAFLGTNPLKFCFAKLYKKPPPYLKAAIIVAVPLQFPEQMIRALGGFLTFPKRICLILFSANLLYRCISPKNITQCFQPTTPLSFVTLFGYLSVSKHLIFFCIIQYMPNTCKCFDNLVYVYCSCNFLFRFFLGKIN